MRFAEWMMLAVPKMIVPVPKITPVSDVEPGDGVEPEPVVKVAPAPPNTGPEPKPAKPGAEKVRPRHVRNLPEKLEVSHIDPRIIAFFLKPITPRFA